MFTKIP